MEKEDLEDSDLEDNHRAITRVTWARQWESILRPWIRFVALRGHGRHLFAIAYQAPVVCCPMKKGPVRGPSSGCHPH